jgi:hypothetical protein
LTEPIVVPVKLKLVTGVKKPGVLLPPPVPPAPLVTKEALIVCEWLGSEENGVLVCNQVA